MGRKELAQKIRAAVKEVANVNNAPAKRKHTFASLFYEVRVLFPSPAQLGVTIL